MERKIWFLIFSVLISTCHAAPTFVDCPAGFTGKLCNQPICKINTQSQTSFSPDGQTLSFFVHDSTSTYQMIQKMQIEMEKVITDITKKYPKWINELSFLTFNDTSIMPKIASSDPKAFLQSFKQFAESSAQSTTKRSCQNLLVIESLYNYLSSGTITNTNIIYIFMNGYMNFDPIMFAKVENLLISTKAKVNFVQTSAYPCGESVNSKKPSLMWNITSISGGEVYVISSPTTWDIMELIPFQYKSSLIAEKVFDDCSMGQTFKIPIDSQISTSSILVYGELNGNPIYISPKGINNSIFVSNAFLDYSTNIRLDQLIESCSTDEYYSQYENGKCWIFLTKPLTWKEAKNECEKRNSKLVTIFDQNDEEYLKEAAGITQFWTGLNDFQNNGKFVWDQGRNKSIPLSNTNFTNWGKNQPNLKDGSCVKSDKNDRWQTADCNEKRVSICSINYRGIEPGYWTIKLKTYDGPCSVTVTAQSNIQIYQNYVKNIHSDAISSSPSSKNLFNYATVHVSDSNPSTILKNAAFTSSNTNFSLAMNLRDSQTCKFEYVSDKFHCASSKLYQTTFTGVDSNGYNFQRIHPTFCL